MPIRFRKSVKIAPGTRLNLSKRGVSASVGAGGVRASTGKSGNCLYYIFVFPFVFVFQLYKLLFQGIAWLFKKATATPQSRRISLIVLGLLVVLGACQSLFMMITGKDPTETPQPTLDMIAAQNTALAQAWSSYTQTAAALPTQTPIPTDTLAPLSTQTLIPASTATTFISVLPINKTPTFSSRAPEISDCPCSGDTLNCSDFFSHASAQACFNYCISQGVGDIHRLDKDGNGSACESLP